MMKGLAVLAVLLCGCDLYFGGDDEPPCAYGADGREPYYETRDPNTGICQPTGGYDCPDSCGPCAYDTTAGALADWGMCYGKCSGLDEQACFTTSGCYAAYLQSPDDGHEFWGCWDTAPSGPVQGQCASLDAHGCSRHDDCVAVYTADTKNTQTQFSFCAPEPPATTTYCVGDADCGGNAFCDTSVCYPSPTCTPCDTCGACPDSNTCYGVCVPKEPLACEVIDCAPGYTCAEVCTTDANGQGTCMPTCVPNPNDPGQCYGTLQCLMPAPACPTGTTPGIKNGCYTGYCIPTSACGPNDPGDCTGSVACAMPPPSCPSGTVPGRTSGCWTGYCIPQSACPMAACEALTSEAACIARGDCLPIYDGDQCTCDLNGCECQVLTYDRCESL